MITTWSVVFVSAEDGGFELKWSRTKEYEIDICCFCAKHASLRSKKKLVGMEFR
jgi:hypothetical protein